MSKERKILNLFKRKRKQETDTITEINIEQPTIELKLGIWQRIKNWIHNFFFPKSNSVKSGLYINPLDHEQTK